MKIISVLQKNGRATLAEIAKPIAITSMGAKKRLDKLISRDFVRIKPLLNAEKLNLMAALVAMEIESAEALEKLLNRFCNCPRVIKFYVTTGSYNLFALVVAEDYHSLESVSLERCSLRGQEGVKRFELYPIQEIHYESFLDIRVFPDKKLKTSPCGVYCGSCKRFEQGRCPGCPATIFYKGRL